MDSFSKARQSCCLLLKIHYYNFCGVARHLLHACEQDRWKALGVGSVALRKNGYTIPAVRIVLGSAPLWAPFCNAQIGISWCVRNCEASSNFNMQEGLSCSPSALAVVMLRLNRVEVRLELLDLPRNVFLSMRKMVKRYIWCRRKRSYSLTDCRSVLYGQKRSHWLLENCASRNILWI